MALSRGQTPIIDPASKTNAPMMKNVTKTLFSHFRQAARAAFALLAPTQVRMAEYNSVTAKAARTFYQTNEMTKARQAIMSDFDMMNDAVHKLFPAKTRNHNNKWRQYHLMHEAALTANAEVLSATAEQLAQRDLLARQRNAKIYHLPTVLQLDATRSRLWEANLVYQDRMMDVAETIIAIVPSDSDIALRAIIIVDELEKMPERAQTKWQHRQPGAPLL